MSSVTGYAENEIQLDPADSMETILEKAVQVRPSARQLAWQEAEFACFIHFGVNTFTNQEWGDGTEDPAIFNPTAFDAKQWVRTCKAAGMRKLILTCKHHDGFCMWPSAYTEHSVKNSPWRDGKGDIVREVSDACHEAGLQFGVYLSPWDRNNPSYGDSPKYNEYFVNQLRELLSNYGPIAEVWFDGACAEGPNGKRQEYDFPAYYAVVRELQPDAVISIVGPDVRWVGNEAGDGREAEWSVVAEGIGPMEEDLGSRAVLQKAAERSAKLLWHPAQVDTSIRPGWFYHADQDSKVRSLDTLLNIYYASIGGNAELLLNLPPDQRGLIHENDAQRLKELGNVIAATFNEDLALNATASANAGATTDGDPKTFWTTKDGESTATIEYQLTDAKTFNRAMLQEYIPEGQRIESFAVDAWWGDAWKVLAEGQTVGYKKLVRFDTVTTAKVRLRIIASRIRPTLSHFGLYFEPPFLTAPTINRDKNGNVTLSAAPGVEIRYHLGHWPKEAALQRYTGPIAFPAGGLVRAVSVAPTGTQYVNLGQGLLAEQEYGMATTRWKVQAADGDKDAEKVFDNNPSTFWQSKRKPGTKSIAIDLGASCALTGFTYLPNAKEPKGRIMAYRFFVSKNGKQWKAVGKDATFDNMENNAEPRTVRFDTPVQGRYIKLEALSTVGNATYASISELQVHGEGGEGNEAAPEAADKKQWTALTPDPAQAPERTTDALPLSDQENRGNWVQFAPFTDEFDGDSLDAAKWWDHNPGWRGRRPSLFKPENVDVRDGQLHLTMRAEEPPEAMKQEGYHTFTSAAVQSKDVVRYGYFEIKARAMASAGSSAFWFYKSEPHWWTEIDVFEICGKKDDWDRKHFMTEHVLRSPSGQDHWSVGGHFLAPGRLSDDWHVYGLEWDEDDVKLYFDGMLVRRGPNTYWHQPLTLNFDSETMPKWWGLPDVEDLPSTFSIEYVRAWKRAK